MSSLPLATVTLLWLAQTLIADPSCRHIPGKQGLENFFEGHGNVVVVHTDGPLEKSYKKQTTLPH